MARRWIKSISLKPIKRVVSIPWSAKCQLERIHLKAQSHPSVSGNSLSEASWHQASCLLATNPSLLLESIARFYSTNQRPALSVRALVQCNLDLTLDMNFVVRRLGNDQPIVGSRKIRGWKKFFRHRKTPRQWRGHLRRLLREFCSGKSSTQNRIAKKLVVKDLCRELAELTKTTATAKQNWQVARNVRRTELWQISLPPNSDNSIPAQFIERPTLVSAKRAPDDSTEMSCNLGSLPDAVIQTTSSPTCASLQDLKLQSLRQLAYGASHEINNPLANIAMRSQALARGETDPDRRRKLLSIHQQAMRAHEMISDLMLFAHPPKPEWTEFSLTTTIESVLESYRKDAAVRGISITVQPTNDRDRDLIWGDATMIAELLHAMTDNSIQAVGSGGSIIWNWQRDDVQFQLSITDTGAGIPAEIREHVFDPFFSGREAGRGLGFGLSKSWRIVELHGGSISCVDGNPGNTRFEIRLPHNPQLARTIGLDAPVPCGPSGF